MVDLFSVRFPSKEKCKDGVTVWILTEMRLSNATAMRNFSPLFHLSCLYASNRNYEKKQNSVRKSRHEPLKIRIVLGPGKDDYVGASNDIGHCR
jgi:hypothetical protein